MFMRTFNNPSSTWPAHVFAMPLEHFTQSSLSAVFQVGTQWMFGLTPGTNKLVMLEVVTNKCYTIAIVTDRHQAT